MSLLELKALVHQAVTEMHDAEAVQKLLDTALQLRDETEPPFEVSDELLAAIKRGMADVAAGRFVSHTEMRARREAWERRHGL